jgi:hypothetical protein
MTPYAEKTKDEKTVWRVAYYVTISTPGKVHLRPCD